jgi:hypothetical protein
MRKSPSNEKYNVHASMDREVRENNSNDECDEPKLFVVRGKPDFTVDLSEYNWKRINTPTPEQKKFFESTPGYKEHKELIIYGGSQGIAVVQANYKKDKHKVDIYLNDCTGGDTLQMQVIKNMFEMEWGLTLENTNGFHTKKYSKLEGKAKSN